LKEINIEQWARCEHFKFFNQMENPHYSINFNIDVTDLVPILKEQGYKFYDALIYFSTLAANNVEAFRYRCRDGKVYLHEQLDPSFIILDQDTELPKFISVPFNDDISILLKDIQSSTQKTDTPFLPHGDTNRDDFLYITTIPWFTFTSMTHAVSSYKDCSIPKVSWSRYFEESGRVYLPYSVQVNHSFVDGLHIYRYKESLEQAIVNFVNS